MLAAAGKTQVAGAPVLLADATLVGETNRMPIKNSSNVICEKWTVALAFPTVVCDGCA
jgi:hypothetical protein